MIRSLWEATARFKVISIKISQIYELPPVGLLPSNLGKSFGKAYRSTHMKIAQLASVTNLTEITTLSSISKL